MAAADPDTLARLKAEARQAAVARRALAFDALGPEQSTLLKQVLADRKGQVLAGYMPMRSEISPLGAMAAMARHGAVCVPVIEAKATPLRFARWTPDTAMVAGSFGAQVPAICDWLEPAVLIVPLLAFDRRGGRLGYGGGFYDRTLALLRQRRPVVAVGFAFAAQEDGNLPLEPTDQPLDMIVTEQEVIPCAGGACRARV